MQFHDSNDKVPVCFMQFNDSNDKVPVFHMAITCCYKNRQCLLKDKNNALICVRCRKAHILDGCTGLQFLSAGGSDLKSFMAEMSR